MNDIIYPIAAIALIALITFALRGFPFLLFGHRPLPKVILYLGKVLPPAIMTILVIYCLRNTDFTHFPFGLAEVIASLCVVILHIIKKNMYLSIIAGTVCYMILIRLL